MTNYFEILEDSYRSEKAIEYSRLYRIALKIYNFFNSIKKGCFFDNIRNEWRMKRARKYNVMQPTSDFKYGQYPDNNKRILVYACVTNNYDLPTPPLFSPVNVEYILFSDNTNLCVDGWRVKAIPSDIMALGNGTIVNRYLKMHPDVIGKGFDYAIYVDGNVQIMSNIRNIVNAVSSTTGLAIHRHSSRNCIYDEYEACRILKKGNLTKLKDQVERYKSEKFPAKFGLLECTIILTDMHNKNGLDLLDKWWNEFIKSESLRDQLSLPYVVWKIGYTIDDIGNLGNNLRLNPKFRYVNHRNTNSNFV